MAVTDYEYTNSGSKCEVIREFLNAFSDRGSNMLWESGWMNFWRYNVHARRAPHDPLCRDTVRGWRLDDRRIVGLCISEYDEKPADLLPSLRATGYVGSSAGSMVMTSNVGADYVGWKPPPHYSRAGAERWAAGLMVPAYAIDDESAIRVVASAGGLISEGHWRRFAA